MAEIDFVGYESYIKREMNEKRKEVLESLETIVSRPWAETFAKILSTAVQNGDADAEKVTDELNFGPLHFLAIENDMKAFERELDIAYRNYVAEASYEAIYG